MQGMFIVPRKLRGKIEEPQEKARVQSESRESESCEMHVTGRTLLIIARSLDKVLFDTDGTPVLESEFYSVTSQGIQRVA